MKKLFTLFSYIGTLGVGAGLGVLCTKSYFEKRESERADSEIESMKRAMRKTEEKKEPEKKTEKDEQTIFVSGMITKPETSEAFQYHTFSASTDIATKDHPREEDIIKPYFIDIDDFDEPTLGYAKKELQYYMDDGTLVDEGENTDDEGAVVSIVDTVGTANLESFENSLESCCYIRNEQLKEDYEISKVFGSYSMLLGDD